MSSKNEERQRVSCGESPSLAVRLVLAIVAGLTLLATGCGGKTFFSGNSSSSSGGGGGGGGGTTRSIYVTNFADGRLSALAQTSGAPGSPASLRAGRANGPMGLALAASESALYVANSADKKVHEFAIDKRGNLNEFASVAAGAQPQTVLVTANGKFAYAINFSGSISQYTIGNDGALATNNPPSFITSLATPLSGVFASSVAYVTDPGVAGGVVSAFSINVNGTLGALLSQSLSRGIAGGNPAQIAIDNTGSWVFVGDATDGVVSVFHIQAGGGLALFSQTTPLGGPAAGLAFAVTPSGATFLFVAVPSLNSVTAYTFGGGVLTIPVTASGITAATGLAVDNPTSAANLFVTNAGNGTVTGLSINSATGVLSNSQSSPTENPLNSASSPMFVAVNG